MLYLFNICLIHLLSIHSFAFLISLSLSLFAFLEILTNFCTSNEINIFKRWKERKRNFFVLSAKNTSNANFLSHLYKVDSLKLIT